MMKRERVLEGCAARCMNDVNGMSPSSSHLCTTTTTTITTTAAAAAAMLDRYDCSLVTVR